MDTSIESLIQQQMAQVNSIRRMVAQSARGLLAGTVDAEELSAMLIAEERETAQLHELIGQVTAR